MILNKGFLRLGAGVNLVKVPVMKMGMVMQREGKKNSISVSVALQN